MSEEEAINYLKESLKATITHKEALNTILDSLNKEKDENETLKQLLQGYLYEMYKYYKEKCKNLSEENINLKILIERQKIDDKNK